jgi:FixJ family two-component response regulator
LTSKASIICVVDDEPSVRTALGRLLRSAGLRAETYASGEAFLEQADLDAIGCVILDVRMKGMSGLEVQRELLVRDSSLPIVFISAHEDEPVKNQALRSGAIAFFTKPLDDDRLLEAVTPTIDP